MPGSRTQSKAAPGNANLSCVYIWPIVGALSSYMKAEVTDKHYTKILYNFLANDCVFRHVSHFKGTSCAPKCVFQDLANRHISSADVA